MHDQTWPDGASFSVHLQSLLDFAGEFTSQIESIQAPMDQLAALSGKRPQYGAFAEAWALGAGEQAAIEEMHDLLGQVKQAIGFAGNVTGTVADDYRKADENIASALGGGVAGAAAGAPGPQSNGSANGSQGSQNSQGSNGPDGSSGSSGDQGKSGAGSAPAGPAAPPAGAAPTSASTSAPNPVPTPAPGQGSTSTPSWTSYFQGTPEAGV